MPEEPTQETPQTDIPAVEPAIDLDATVKVDGEEISVRDLLTSRDEATKLKEYNEHAKTLISSGQHSDQDRETSVRYLMSQEGYTPEEINEYVNWSQDVGTDAPAAQPVYEQPTPVAQEEEVPQNEDYYQQYQQETAMREQENQRMHEIEERQHRLGADMMKKELSTAIDTTLTNNEYIQKLMSIESGGENRKGVLKNEIENATLEGLRIRRAGGESYSNAWFAEEASKAAQLVYDKFRSVIGDPDKIQRSPETATNSDSLFNKPPVEPPKYEKGDNMGDINVKAREYTLDHLLRGAQDTGGESKA
jgi:hypothetical protein